MRTVTGVLTMAMILLVLSACSESAELFASLEDPPEIRVDTVATGSVLAPGSTFSFQLDYGDDEFQALTEVTLEIFDASLISVHVDTITGADLEIDLVATFTVPDLPQGPYRIVFTGYRGQEIVIREERSVFVLDPIPAISAIVIHPSSPAPGATALAIVELLVGDELAPYLRWRFGGAIIREGYVHDGADQVQLALPEEPGVYRVDLEFYPWGPDEGVNVGEASLITQSAEVFVGTPAQEAVPEDLILAWEFDGTTAALGAIDQDVDALVEDDPSFEFFNGALGILADAGIPVRVPVSIVPAQNGAVLVELSLSGAEAPEVAVFSMESPSLTLNATLSSDPRRLTVVATTAAVSAEGYLDLLFDGSGLDLEVEVARSDESFLVAVRGGADGDDLELSIPRSPVDSGSVDTLGAAVLLEPGELRFGGGATRLGMINRLAIRAASPETTARLRLIRDIADRDDLRVSAVTLIEVATGRAESAEADQEGDSPSSVRSIPISPGSTLALSLVRGFGRVRLSQDPETTITRDEAGYRLSIGEERIALGDDALILITPVDQDNQVVLRLSGDTPGIPLEEPGDVVSLALTEGALALLEPLEE